MAVDFSNFEQYDVLRQATKLLFEGEYEPVWILNSEEVQLKEIMQYYPPFPEPPKPPPPPPKPAPMVIRVPMCCIDCQERLEVHLKKLKGKSSKSIQACQFPCSFKSLSVDSWKW